MGKTIVAIVAFVASGSIFFLYTKPTYDATASTKTEIAQYDAALTKAAELQQLKQTLLTRYNTFNPADLDRLQKMLPDHVDNVRLILDLDNLAGQNGLALQNVVVSTPATETGPQGAASTISAASTGYDSVTLSFTTVASYEKFLQFLSSLQDSLRIVDLVTLHLVPTGQGTGSAPLYTFDLTLRTYWLK